MQITLFPTSLTSRTIPGLIGLFFLVAALDRVSSGQTAVPRPVEVERFFPDAKQSEQLNHAVVRDGKVVHRRTIMETQGGTSGLSGSASRFHVTPDHRLFVVYPIVDTGGDGRRMRENRIVEILPDGSTGIPVRIPLEKPFIGFFTTTVRAGSSPSWTLEMLGQRERVPNTISYARVNLTRRIASPSEPARP